MPSIFSLAAMSRSVASIWARSDASWMAATTTLLISVR
jgi:hypothetical protein